MHRSTLTRPFAMAALAGLVLAASASLSYAAPGPTLQPYTARYQVSYRGLSGGEIEASFRRGNARDLWQYETRAYPNLFGRIAVSPQARETSTMLVTPEGAKPMSFDDNDGSSSAAKDVRLNYDWGSGKVTGTAEGKPVALPLVPGTQDTASVQAPMSQERLAGRNTQSFKFSAAGKLRE